MCYQARNVPIRTFLKHDHSFGPEDIANLSAAFEAARSKLGLARPHRAGQAACGARWRFDSHAAATPPPSNVIGSLPGEIWRDSSGAKKRRMVLLGIAT